MDFADLTAALDAARDGDEWAMTCLFRGLNPPLLRYLRHHAPEAAEDLASETWLAVAKVLGRFEGDAGDLRAWLFGVARRQVANYWRARHRRPHLVQLDSAPEPLSPSDASEMAIEALSAQQAIEALVRDLPSDQAEVILLRVVAELNVDQVATLLDKSPGSVRVIQHRALRRLEKIWDRKAVTQ
ncbi:MAG: RNA polymerase sigma factor [Acidimicrobiales bacterium]